MISWKMTTNSLQQFKWNNVDIGVVVTHSNLLSYHIQLHSAISLTHCGLGTPYDNIDIGQQSLR